MLEKIVEHKRLVVKKQSDHIPLKKLEASIHYKTKCLSLVHYLTRKESSGIIAEIKRQSPSKGVFKAKIDVEKLSIGYMQAGGSALSVLTDEKFFGGKNEDLLIARKFNLCPILRKDFVVSSYQIYEAKSIGADTILLIASVLTKEEIIEFTDIAHSLGLEVLLEVHSKDELKKVYEKINLIGVNNRNLDNFETNIEKSVEMQKLLPENMCKISESGIKTAEDIVRLKALGYRGFLIGETFMKTSFPDKTLAELIKDIKKLENN